MARRKNSSIRSNNKNNNNNCLSTMKNFGSLMFVLLLSTFLLEGSIVKSTKIRTIRAPVHELSPKQSTSTTSSKSTLTTTSTTNSNNDQEDDFFVIQLSAPSHFDTTVEYDEEDEDENDASEEPSPLMSLSTYSVPSSPPPEMTTSETFRRHPRSWTGHAAQKNQEAASQQAFSSSPAVTTATYSSSSFQPHSTSTSQLWFNNLNLQQRIRQEQQQRSASSESVVEQRQRKPFRGTFRRIATFSRVGRTVLKKGKQSFDTIRSFPAKLIKKSLSLIRKTPYNAAQHYQQCEEQLLRRATGGEQGKTLSDLAKQSIQRICTRVQQSFVQAKETVARHTKATLFNSPIKLPVIQTKIVVETVQEWTKMALESVKSTVSFWMETLKDHLCDPGEYYTILGVKRDATSKEIKSTYRKLALQCHPDKIVDPLLRLDAEARFVQLTKVYSILSNPEKRKVYDSYGKLGIEAIERGLPAEQGIFFRF